MTKKDLFVEQAAAKFHVPKSIVDVIVSEWEKARKTPARKKTSK